jgi:hypothetical protein
MILIIILWIIVGAALIFDLILYIWFDGDAS